MRASETTAPVARTAPNQEWALDFVHDRTEHGRTLRWLVVGDAYTREGLALEVDTSFPSRRVTRVLDAIAAERGLPTYLRCDNVLTAERCGKVWSTLGASPLRRPVEARHRGEFISKWLPHARVQVLNHSNPRSAD